MWTEATLYFSAVGDMRSFVIDAVKASSTCNIMAGLQRVLALIFENSVAYSVALA